MTTPQKMISLAVGWVGQKITDPTNPYGGQCTTLINQLMKQESNGKYDFNYTNAKDGLVKAKSQGLEVIYNDTNNPNLIPQEGDIVVCWWGAGDEFGHILLCVSADVNGMHTIEQNIDGWKDENGNGQNDQLERGGGGYTRRNYRNYEGVIGWFRLPYDEPKPKEEKKKGEIEMFTIGAKDRGIALMQGGVFLSFYKPEDPKDFWEKGIPHIMISQTTFDKWQAQSNVSPYDPAMVSKMNEILKELKD